MYLKYRGRCCKSQSLHIVYQFASIHIGSSCEHFLLLLKVPTVPRPWADQSDSESPIAAVDPPPADATAFAREAPASQPAPGTATLPPDALLAASPVLRPAASGSCTPPLSPFIGVLSMPLHSQQHIMSISGLERTSAIQLIRTCIEMAATMMHIYMTTTEEGRSQRAHVKRSKRRVECDIAGLHQSSFTFQEPEDDTLEHPHRKQIFDLLAWHVHGVDVKWYVKPRSTCWFEEYLFNIYTPDMFYEILRMRRRTFDRLVQDLRPFIEGQITHWRQPIGVEKKVVVTLFKLMHGVSIPLVADKAAIGKSTVHQILRQVCSAISINFGHLIAWPVGRRLARVTSEFQAKQGFPNCIGAIDGSHVYIQAPPNSIVAADHRNRYKSFSILLQGVVDAKCYFTSVNTGPPGSLHDSAHFKSSELYRKVEEGIMGGFHDDPLTWPAGLPFPPYIVADRDYPLLSWCITPIKMGNRGMPLTREEAWFNQKHSSTRMSVERGFGILKSRFKEIGTKTSLTLDFLPTVVHCCCVLHNILLASKDRTLDQILAECQLPPMDMADQHRRGDDEVFQPPRPIAFVSDERALLEGKMAREDLLDYLVRVQNAEHPARHS